jgi:alkanesulfonate monooxygenase SsuD/methylene tetrahydromethanopterin reductase-like flavin-dependent oxidoreductase (luciferase family)
VFGLNVSHGCAATTAEGHLQPTWQNNLDMAVMADRAGIEALVPLARWKGFGGKTHFIMKGFHQPKPIQKPFPPIMHAGSSATGARFAAQYADMVCISIAEDADDETTARISAQRAVGRQEFGREFQVWTACSVVCRPTEQEAVDYARDSILDKGDWEAVTNLARGRRRTGPPGPGERLRSPGWGGYLLIGTPEQIVDRLVHLTAFGLDGVVLSWVNDEAELAYWISDVLPVMKQAGLRRPHVLAHAGS